MLIGFIGVFKGAPFWHFFHYISLVFATLLMGLTVSPPVMVIMVTLLLLPPQKVIGCLKQVFIPMCQSNFGECL